MVSSFFNSNNCSGSVLSNTDGFALYWLLAHAKLNATGSQSHSNCIQAATSCMQILPAWPPVPYNMNKIDDNLSGTGGHMGTICMRLVATRVQFECDWPTLHFEAMKQFDALKPFISGG
jgi:hypothetical protein